MKEKIKVIRDWDNEVCGYQLGNYCLYKHYYWGNNYCWYISKNGKKYFSECERSRAYYKGEIEFVYSCKKGKERLVELYNEVE